VQVVRGGTRSRPSDGQESDGVRVLEMRTMADPARPVRYIPEAEARDSALVEEGDLIVSLTMVTGELKSKIDAIWNDFWSGGISNPLEVIEQLTYLLFIKGSTRPRPARSARPTAPASPSRPDLPGGEFRPTTRPRPRPYEDLRWSRFKNLAPADMYELVDKYVFPFMQARAAHSTHGKHMRGARLTIPTPGCSPRPSTGSTPSRWTTATPRATSTSTCCPRSPPPDRTASSAPHATSSSSWSP
jgi:hypothetical protein